MTRFRQTLTGAAVATALLASLSLPSFAQTAAPAADKTATTQTAHEQGKHRSDKRGDRQEQMQKRMTQFKADLKLTAAQEAAWTTYASTMKPAGERPARMDREAFAKLTTPQRIDKMRELRAQRNAEMDRRAEATKAFYAQLNADQQKTFDAASLRMHKDHGPRHHGHHGGKPGQERPAPAPAAAK
ncbi:Spy/CpxP family protein refolding chaperone [Comamonas aquatilis]|uniref:Spy/CpxP family protein refolding chaperone n=1 Tax=Comamonas aquatilis TaxID=1778406 RepID=UPI0039F0EBB6